MRRFADWLGLEARAEGPGDGVVPPPRTSTSITADTALGIVDIYRAVQIHSTAAMQLPIDVERAGRVIDAPSLILTPSLDMHRSAFVEVTVSALALHGNAFWRKERAGNGDVISLTPLNPRDVTVREDFNGRRTFHYDGKTLTRRDVQQLELMRVPGKCAGLGPIQAARKTLEGHQDVAAYAGGWFRDGQAQPNGVLSTDQKMTGAQAKEYRDQWNEGADGGVRVIGGGFKYDPILLNPADAQWIEARGFNTLEAARLMGAPASLMLAAVEGNSQTYQNVEQDWIGYARFTLMRYLRELEEAFTALIPRGQTARFNIEGLLRSDTLTRYQAHQLALDPVTGWMRPSEVRTIEHLPPMEGIDDDRASRPVAAGAE
jgi:HK97 family phage portal protein